VKDFISDIVGEKHQKTLQEMTGFCLQPGYKHQKAFLLVGEGSNGKSTFLNLLRNFLGEENTTGVPLQRFDKDKFAAANLHGKKANINSDLPDESMKKSSVFKQLTGEDKIYAEEKYEDPFDFYNEAKLIFSTNTLPQVEDHTDAFYRRWIIIGFPYRFTDKEDIFKDADPNLLKEITEDKEEISGMLNWALKGLERLESQGDFTKAKTSWKTKEKWRKMNKPVSTFIREKVKINTSNYIKKQKCYEKFLEYCKKEQIPSMSKMKFFNRMKKENIQEDRPLKDESRPRCYKVRIEDAQA
jgi:putative DNA primase/helicase